VVIARAVVADPVTLARQDVSRLVDLCRQCIIYEDIAALTAGLRAIAADPDVALVRVKNRMRADRAADSTAGYRDVAVNLRVATAETRRLGVETHVAEVQLVLRSFAEIKVWSREHAYIWTSRE
jgi:hypothetical protein